MKTILRKVDLKERLPEIEDNYDVIFFEGSVHRSAATVHFDKQHYFHCADMDCTGITHWLEEVELPDTTSIIKEARDNSITQDEHFGQYGMKVDSFKEGAKWMRDFVLAVTPK